MEALFCFPFPMLFFFPDESVPIIVWVGPAQRTCSVRGSNLGLPSYDSVSLPLRQPSWLFNVKLWLISWSCLIPGQKKFCIIVKYICADYNSWLNQSYFYQNLARDSFIFSRLRLQACFWTDLDLWFKLIKHSILD